RGQRRDGVLLRASPEERPGSQALEDPRRAADRHHHLDREDLPPTTPAGPPGSIDPHRIRDHHEPRRGTRGLRPQLSPIRAAVPSLRASLTYLGHPEYFFPLVGVNDKRAIVQAFFPDETGQPASGDLDVALFRLREWISPPPGPMPNSSSVPLAAYW